MFQNTIVKRIMWHIESTHDACNLLFKCYISHKICELRTLFRLCKHDSHDNMMLHNTIWGASQPVLAQSIRPPCCHCCRGTVFDLGLHWLRRHYISNPQHNRQPEWPKRRSAHRGQACDQNHDYLKEPRGQNNSKPMYLQGGCQWSMGSNSSLTGAHRNVRLSCFAWFLASISCNRSWINFQGAGSFLKPAISRAAPRQQPKHMCGSCMLSTLGPDGTIRTISDPLFLPEAFPVHMKFGRWPFAAERIFSPRSSATAWKWQ